MTHIRTITVETAEAWGLPHDCTFEDNAAEFPEAAVELHDEQTGTRRWVSDRRLIFRAPDDGKTYSVDYVLGLTEHQDGISPWEYQPADGIELTEVEQVPVTVWKWQPVGEQQPGPDPAVTAAAYRQAAADIEAQTCQCGCRRAADFLRHRATEIEQETR
jgi:hypothetical protein